MGDRPVSLDSVEASEARLHVQIIFQRRVVCRRSWCLFAVVVLLHARLDHVESLFSGNSEWSALLGGHFAVIILLLVDGLEVLSGVFRTGVVVINLIDVQRSLLTSWLSKAFTRAVCLLELVVLVRYWGYNLLILLCSRIETLLLAVVDTWWAGLELRLTVSDVADDSFLFVQGVSWRVFSHSWRRITFVLDFPALVVRKLSLGLETEARRGSHIRWELATRSYSTTNFVIARAYWVVVHGSHIFLASRSGIAGRSQFTMAFSSPVLTIFILRTGLLTFIKGMKFGGHSGTIFIRN